MSRESFLRLIDLWNTGHSQQSLWEYLDITKEEYHDWLYNNVTPKRYSNE